MVENAQNILDFWFDEISKPFWFKQEDEFDNIIRQNYWDTWTAAVAGELSDWRESIYGRLAEIIVIDQFSRNLFRDDARAFAYDSMALVLAQEAVRDEEFPYMLTDWKHFMLMPFMHSESALVHEQARRLFSKHTSAYALEAELKHKEIIDRFGRYPHRNAVLGRTNTAEENAWLKENKGF
ncbi:DUF924 family protein [Wielerella bovis]|uniref:DUF924 family protein n=1 Tax=Wielerella bovis TaxID=2917790 RepID=UPI002019BBB0|nr:DUF924 family protein [Wielerella bovis]MCG7656088.1 DUF924 domain-containing protein [Wielerella bovis]MCG7658314.1 DUF924 domain-containing protein [Wielerella bovis]ULJ62632.1 DUF924 domain-containing protein [Wielerella bovis]